MVPFYDLWIDGGETEKRPPYPQHVIEPAKMMEGIFGTRHERFVVFTHLLNKE